MNLHLLLNVVSFITMTFYFDDNGDGFPTAGEPRLRNTPVEIIMTNEIGTSALITPTNANGLINVINPGIDTHFKVTIPGCLNQVVEFNTDAFSGVAFIPTLRTCRLGLPVIYNKRRYN